MGDGGVDALCRDIAHGRRISSLSLSRTVLSRGAALNLLRTLRQHATHTSTLCELALNRV